jgi:hypothetical protein
MGETRILPTHDKRNPLVLIPDPLCDGIVGNQRIASVDLGSAESRAMCSGQLVQFRMILKIILKKKEKSSKLQASSLTTAEG